MSTGGSTTQTGATRCDRTLSPISSVPTTNGNVRGRNGATDMDITEHSTPHRGATVVPRNASNPGVHS